MALTYTEYDLLIDALESHCSLEMNRNQNSILGLFITSLSDEEVEEKQLKVNERNRGLKEMTILLQAKLIMQRDDISEELGSLFKTNTVPS